MLQKRVEFDRLNQLIALGKELEKDSDKEVKEYLENCLGAGINWIVFNSREIFNDSEKSATIGGGSTPAAISLGKPNIGNTFEVNGLKLSSISSNAKNRIRKFIIMHEYGHLYEWLKDMVEKNEGYIIDTNDPDIQKVTDSEGKANAYAIDNMYRKDRRELLKNSKLKMKDFEDSENHLSQSHYKSDEYKAGTRRHSKTLKRTLDSLKEDVNYFSY